MLDKSKKNIIVGTVLFSFIWTLLIMPYAIKNEAWNSLIPPVQYVLLNLGYIVLVSLIFGYLMSKESSLKSMVLKGLSGWIFFSFFLDLLSPPLYINPQGNFMIEPNGSLSQATPDATVFYIFNQLLPNLRNSTINIPLINAEYSLMYVAIYALVPVIATILMAWTLSKGKFRGWTKEVIRI